MSSKLPKKVLGFLQKLDLEQEQFFIAEFERCAKAVKHIETKKAANQLVTPATINRELHDLAVSLRSLNKKLQSLREDSIAAGDLFIEQVLRKELNDVPFRIESRSGDTDYAPVQILSFLKQHAALFARACELALNQTHRKSRGEYIFPQIWLAHSFKISGGTLTQYASSGTGSRTRKGGIFAEVLVEFIEYCDVEELENLDIDDKYMSRLIADVETLDEASKMG